MEALEAVRELRRHLAQVERRAFKSARDLGYSVHELADSLGISRQAVYNRLHLLEKSAAEREGDDDVVRIPDSEERDTDRPSPLST
jgi:DNA-directed RNA polymerase specialized sigma24 family protein